MELIIDLEKAAKEKQKTPGKPWRSKKGAAKMKTVFKEWKAGTQHSGRGGTVVPHTKKGHKQAIAIALSMGREAMKKATGLDVYDLEDFELLNKATRTGVRDSSRPVQSRMVRPLRMPPGDKHYGGARTGGPTEARVTLGSTPRNTPEQRRKTPPKTTGNARTGTRATGAMTRDVAGRSTTGVGGSRGPGRSS